MAVLTRSQILSAIRRRRNIVRNVEWVIRERTMDPESDPESDYELPDTDSEYFPPSDTDPETTEEESDDDTVSVQSDDGEAMKERVERLREDLRNAEEMLKKWQAEQDAQLRENNNTCLPNILAIAITWGIFTWIDLNVRHKNVNWY